MSNSTTRREDDRLAAAIVGMYAAVNVCREQGIDPQDMLTMILEHAKNRQDKPA